MLPVVKSITVSAPGKLFIFGEYACLHDRPAMLCAVNRRISVHITPLDSDQVILSFQKLHWEGTLHHLEPQGDFFDLARFIIQTLNPPCGLRCSITSELSSELGLGSSAAFTVAMTTALMKLNDPRWPLDPEEVYRTAYNRIVLPFYKVGSGADIAAAIWGGVIYYQRSPFSVCHLPSPPDLIAFYTGSKAKTPAMIAAVYDYFEPFPDLFQQIIHLIGRSTELAAEAWEAENWALVGRLMDLQYRILTLLPIGNKNIAACVQKYRRYKAVLGTKTSGAGGGDCVIAITDRPREQITRKWPSDCLDLSIEPKGLIVHVS